MVVIWFIHFCTLPIFFNLWLIITSTWKLILFQLLCCKFDVLFIKNKITEIRLLWFICSRELTFFIFFIFKIIVTPIEASCLAGVLQSWSWINTSFHWHVCSIILNPHYSCVNYLCGIWRVWLFSKGQLVLLIDYVISLIFLIIGYIGGVSNLRMLVML